jgi:hypothetical protein
MQLSKTIKRVSVIVLANIWMPLVVLAGTSANGFTDPLHLPVNADPKVAVAAMLNRIITFLLGLVGGLAMIAIIWGGIMYVISLGDESRTKKAKTIITMAVVGLVVVILAMTIINTVANALGV